MKATQKLKLVLGKVANTVGEGKCWLPVFSPFPTLFSKGFFLTVVKSQQSVVKNYMKN